MSTRALSPRFQLVIAIVCTVTLLITAAVFLHSSQQTASNAAAAQNILASAKGGAVTVTHDQVRSELSSLKSERDSWTSLTAAERTALSNRYLATGNLSDSGIVFNTGTSEAWRLASGYAVLTFRAAEGQGVAPQTSRTVVFDKSGKLVSTAELDLAQVTADSGQMQVWENGKLEKNVIADNSGHVEAVASSNLALSGERASSRDVHLASYVGPLPAKYHKGDWWGNFNQCLSNAGIAAWTITLISIACAAICVATVGVGCVACIAAAAGGTGGTIGFCIGQANVYS